PRRAFQPLEKGIEGWERRPCPWLAASSGQAMPQERPAGVQARELIENLLDRFSGFLRVLRGLRRPEAVPQHHFLECEVIRGRVGEEPLLRVVLEVDRREEPDLVPAVTCDTDHGKIRWFPGARHR